MVSQCSGLPGCVVPLTSDDGHRQHTHHQETVQVCDPRQGVVMGDRTTESDGGVTCVVLAVPLASAGFRFTCSAAATRDARAHVAPTTCQATDDDARARAHDDEGNKTPMTARVAKAPAIFAHLVDRSLLQVAHTQLHGLSASSIQSVVRAAAALPPPVLLVFGKKCALAVGGTSIDEDGDVHHGAHGGAAGAPRTRRVSEAHDNVAAKRRGDTDAGDADCSPSMLCDVLTTSPRWKWAPERVAASVVAPSRAAVGQVAPADKHVLVWVRLPLGSPGGPFFHDYIARCDSNCTTGALPRAITRLPIASTLSSPDSDGDGASTHNPVASGSIGRCAVSPNNVTHRDLCPTRQRPTGFVFHCSRCGSTLVANAIRAWGLNVLSEPGAVNDVLVRWLAATQKQMSSPRLSPPPLSSSLVSSSSPGSMHQADATSSNQLDLVRAFFVAFSFVCVFVFHALYVHAPSVSFLWPFLLCVFLFFMLFKYSVRCV